MEGQRYEWRVMNGGSEINGGSKFSTKTLPRRQPKRAAMGCRYGAGGHESVFENEQRDKSGREGRGSEVERERGREGARERGSEEAREQGRE
eukprot:1514358-Rhodomonas_salina.3